MANNDEVQPDAGNEPPAGEADQGATGSAEQPAVPSAEEIAQLRRDAAQARASQSRAEKLNRELEAYRTAENQAQLDAAGEGGKLQVQLEQANKRAETAERKAMIAERKQAYPLAAKVLDEDIATLSEERIAALNATLKVDLAAEAEPPKPRGNNAPRSDGQTADGGRDKSYADMLAELRGMQLDPALFGTPISES